MLKEGQIFGEKERYMLVRLLGRGSFAEVWLADDTWTKIQVAIKIYAPGTGLDDDGIKIFTQEFSMVFDMNHTNLLKPTYFDSWERQPYLIMPLCKNGSAFKYVTGKEHITEKEAWKMLHDVAAGLAYLHSKKPPVIHQDIKPDNILISDEGRYMITDFGISARARNTIRGGAQEQSGGTLAYMGPERFSSTPIPIMASDVWSLGAMMYEIMTAGNPPFGNYGGVTQKNGADIPIMEENFSEELKSIVYSCLAKETWERPSAQAIEEMTYNHLHGINVGTVPLTGMQVKTEPQPAPQSQSQPQPVPQPQPQPAPQPASQPTPQPVPQPKQEPAPKVEPKPAKQQKQKPQPAPKAAPQPEPQAQQIAKKSQPLNANPVADIVDKFKKMPRNLQIGIGAGIVALLLIIGLVAFCSGGGDQAEEPVVETLAPQVNLDSIAQSKLIMANEYAQKAADHQAKYSEELLNPENGKIEEYYIEVINKCKEYDTEAEAAAGSALTNASLGKQLNALKTNAESQLYSIYVMLEQDIKAFTQLGSKETADLYQERADAIRPYIEKLIETTTSETKQTELTEQTEE